MLKTSYRCGQNVVEYLLLVVAVSIVLITVILAGDKPESCTTISGMTCLQLSEADCNLIPGCSFDDSCNMYGACCGDAPICSGLSAQACVQFPGICIYTPEKKGIFTTAVNNVLKVPAALIDEENEKVSFIGYTPPSECGSCSATACGVIGQDSCGVGCKGMTCTPLSCPRQRATRCVTSDESELCSWASPDCKCACSTLTNPPATTCLATVCGVVGTNSFGDRCIGTSCNAFVCDNGAGAWCQQTGSDQLHCDEIFSEACFCNCTWYGHRG